MKHLIRFRGLSLAKDEQAVAHGELSLCANMEIHDGALRPAVLSGTRLNNPLRDDVTGADGNTSSIIYKLLYVHKTTSYTHYIALNVESGELNWFLADGSSAAMHTINHAFADGVTAVDSVGNTLIVISPGGLHYILWRNTDNNYKYLGQKPPFITISFDLSTNYSANYETGGIDVEGSADGFNCAFQQTTIECAKAFDTVTKSSAFGKGETQLRVKTAQQSEVTECIWGLVNRTNNLIAKDGHFYANFYVRYCYRLYDGSMIMHSAPVFMPVLVPDNYLVYVVNAHMDSNSSVGLDDTIRIHRYDATGKEYAFNVTKLTFMYAPRNVALRYALNGAVDALKEWSDIVTSVDVFVTPPVTRTDASQAIKSCVLQPDNYCQLGLWEQVWKYDANKECRTVIEFPGVTGKGYADKIANQSSFFRVCSFKIDDIAVSSTFQDIPLDKSVLENIATQEQMRDDYKTHNYIYPRGIYVYNHRINVYGIYERLFHGFNSAQMFPYYPFLLNSTLADGNINIIKIVTRINTDDGYKYVEVSTSNAFGIDPYYLYNMPLFYPDARADRMYVNYTDNSSKQAWAEFKLSACNELNGAIHVGDFTATYPTMAVAPQYVVDDAVTMYNRIYTSEQDNPFYFPVEAINSVGTGDIVGLAATTRALSQGQFGQFPLMAFTSDGIWALQVASSGTYSSMQPISREVCVNAASICQLDQSVVFATDRALNKVVESSVASFSDILDGPFFDVARCLPKLYQYLTGQSSTGMAQLVSFDTPPIECFKTGKVINDFANNRIIILPEPDEQAQQVVLVYSIRDDAWSTMLVDTPIAVINAYPYPYLQQADGSVLVLDKKYDYTDDSTHEGIVVTRTLSFEQAMLSITGFEQHTDNDNAPMVFLFGSNNNRTWHYIGRSNHMIENYLPSHPYRFFRVAIFANMTQGEKYFQINLDVTQKYEKL